MRQPQCMRLMGDQKNMQKSREEILNDVLLHLRQLADDWEYEGEITKDTLFFDEMGLQSLDVVVLATVVQQQYDQALPFSDFFTDIGQREQRDVTVGEWADFIYTHLQLVVV